MMSAQKLLHPVTLRSHLDKVIRYDTRCYFNVRSKADMSPLNLPHGKNAKNNQFRIFISRPCMTSFIRLFGTVSQQRNCTVQSLTETAGLYDEGTSSGDVMICLIQRLHAVEIQLFARVFSITVLTRCLQKQRQLPQYCFSTTVYEINTGAITVAVFTHATIAYMLFRHLPSLFLCSVSQMDA